MWVSVVVMFSVFFLFKQKTAYEMRISDWSSDVCSSDLRLPKVGFRSKIKAERAEVLLYKLEALAIEVIDFAVLREARLIPAGVKQVKVVKKGEITRDRKSVV